VDRADSDFGAVMRIHATRFFSSGIGLGDEDCVPHGPGIRVPQQRLKQEGRSSAVSICRVVPGVDPTSRRDAEMTPLPLQADPARVGGQIGIEAGDLAGLWQHLNQVEEDLIGGVKGIPFTRRVGFIYVNKWVVKS